MESIDFPESQAVHLDVYFVWLRDDQKHRCTLTRGEWVARNRHSRTGFREKEVWGRVMWMPPRMSSVRRYFQCPMWMPTPGHQWLSNDPLDRVTNSGPAPPLLVHWVYLKVFMVAGVEALRGPKNMDFPSSSWPGHCHCLKWQQWRPTLKPQYGTIPCMEGGLGPILETCQCDP